MNPDVFVSICSLRALLTPPFCGADRCWAELLNAMKDAVGIPSDQYSAELVPGRRERTHAGGAGYGGPVLIGNAGRRFHQTLKALNMKQRPSVCSRGGREAQAET